MSRILYFNPENDLALAAGRTCYTPPAAATALKQSGIFLPFWIAVPGDAVLVPQGTIKACHRFCNKFGLHGEPITDLSNETRDFSPWGWSLHSAGIYRRSGYPEYLLPTDDTFEQLRTISHRRSAIRINHFINPENDLAPIEAVSEKDALYTIAGMKMGCVIKSPWSSSGRGVRIIDRTPSRADIAFIHATITRQGSVMIERKLNRLIDFAALFRIENRAVTFIGISVFFNSHNTSYGGNIIAHQDTLRRYLTEFVSSAKLDRALEGAREALASILNNISYNGYAGIDMMIHRDASDRYSIAPCIELNMRTTMGVIAKGVAETIDDKYIPGKMIVHPGKSAQNALCINGMENSPFAITLTV